MVADEFTIVAARIRDAREPEEVFGVEGSDVQARRRSARRAFRRLARVVHPDRSSHPDAAETFRLLEALWRRAWELLDDGSYGASRTRTVVVRAGRGREWTLQGRIAVGEVCDVFQARSADSSAQPQAFKVARKPRDNDLLQVEARTLRRLRRDVDDRWAAFLPDLVDHVDFAVPGGVRRRANVLRRLDGFHTVAEVIAAHPAGIDPRDMAWMWRRLLGVLGAVHRAGVVHGAVVPSNVLIHPEKHGLVLCDWLYAVEAGAPQRVVSRAYRTWYPHELADDGRLSSASDIYMGAITMLATVRGIDRLPTPLRAFFRACTQLPERLRPDDAWEMQTTFDDVLERCYGRRRFRPFAMPASTR